MSEWKKEKLSWAKSIFIIIVLMMLVRIFLFTPYKVEGISMEPTLHNQERILVSQPIKERKYARGDIVIINGKENERYIKRIIGVAGDKIEVKNDMLYINDILQTEEHLNENRKKAQKQGEKWIGDFKALLVPENQYFVMGDNRFYSMDSRNGLGLIKQDQVIGESIYVYYPFSQFRKID